MGVGGVRDLTALIDRGVVQTTSLRDQTRIVIVVRSWIEDPRAAALINRRDVLVAALRDRRRITAATVCFKDLFGSRAIARSSLCNR